MHSIHDAFATHVEQRGDHLAVWSRAEDISWSFLDLNERIDGWVVHLKEIAQPVAVATGNRADFLALCLALFRLQIPFAVVDGTLSPEDKLQTCQRLGIPSLLHVDEEGETLFEQIRITMVPQVVDFVAPQGTALIKVTSGSTGEPSGICLTEQALLVGIEHLREGMALSADDRVLMAISLSHSYGFDNGLLSLAVVGTSLILEGSIYPSPLLKALEEGQVTFFPTVPPIVRGLSETDWPQGLSPVKVICAGAPLPEGFAARFTEKSGWNIHQFYGSTETGGISFESAPQEAEAANTVGFPLPGIKIELSSESHVEVCSSANFCGYVGESGPGTPLTVRTGDLGEWTEEGRLRLVGRTSSMLNIGGKKLSIARVENALMTIPGITDAAVVGVDDLIRGQRVVAFLVSHHEPADFSPLSSELVPREIRYVDSLPYTARGKLDRSHLQDLAEEGNS